MSTGTRRKEVLVDDSEKIRKLVELLEDIMRDIQRFLRDIEPSWDRDYQ
jgi:hypothetical protein